MVSANKGKKSSVFTEESKANHIYSHKKAFDSEMFLSSGNKLCCSTFIKGTVYFERKFVLPL